MSNNQIIKGQLATEYKKAAIHASRENMRKVAEEFNKMIRDAEETYAERPDILEREIANINRQMESVMRANEQIFDNLLDNLLQLLTTNLDN